MSIEFNNVPPSNAQVTDIASQARTAPQPATDKTEKPAGEQAARSDQVSLTPKAQQLRGLDEQIANQPVVDAERVNAVKEALANGSYEIDSDRIAGKMMDLEKIIGDLS